MHNNALGDIKLVQRVMCGRWVCEGGGREGDREPGASSALFMNGMERLHGRARSRARLDPASAVQHFDARAERVCGAQISIPSRHRSRDFCTSPLASRRGTGEKKKKKSGHIQIGEGRGWEGEGESNEGLRLILDILCLTFSPPKRKRRGGRSGGRGTRLLQQSVATGGGS